MEKIAILGTGYVGLVTGAGLADFGNHVTCVDLDESKIAKLKDGKIPFYEFSLGEVVQRNVDNDRLVFTSDLAKAIKGARTIFIAVGTPPGKGGEADLSQVFGAARMIAETMTSYKLVVQKSTVPVGTGRNVHELIGKVLKERKKNVPYDVASNPEFLREGSAVEDFMRPDRVVIGTWSKKAEQILTEIYRPLYLNETPMVRTNVQTAELIKYASNAFLATKISFINEMSNICEAVGGDVKVVAKAMGQDRRIGPKFLHAGPGYGGSCFPKDTLALADFSKALGVPSAIVNATIAVNKRQRQSMLTKVESLTGDLAGKTIAVLGLSFKPQTDDVRDSVALELIKAMQKKGATVRAYDPIAMETAAVELRNVDFAQDAYEAARGADALVIATEWNEFRQLDLGTLKKSLKKACVVDCRNIYDPAKLRDAGFQYVGVGRGFDGGSNGAPAGTAGGSKAKATKKAGKAKKKGGAA
ncbi:MAG: UDP-glucose/GDP-mannose dehydrogenase family protein [Candidatus Eisenbacteria bacterium]